MTLVEPEGPVYQAGTLSANPVGMRAGLATLKRMTDIDGWQELESRTTGFVDELQRRIGPLVPDLVVAQDTQALADLGRVVAPGEARQEALVAGDRVLRPAEAVVREGVEADEEEREEAGADREQRYGVSDAVRRRLAGHACIMAGPALETRPADLARVLR